MSKLERATTPLVLVAGLLTASDASAAFPLDAHAAELKLQGDSAIEAGDIDAAIDAYSRAIAIQAAPALYYNRGRAFQLAGHFAAALLDLEEFQRMAPPEMLRAVPRLDQLLADLQQRVGTLDVGVNVAHARVLIDDLDVTHVLGRGLRLDGGTYALRVEAIGYETHVESIVLEAGATQHHEVLLLRLGDITERVPRHSGFVRSARAGATPEADEQARDRDKPFYRKWWFWSGCALVTMGIVTLVAIDNPLHGGASHQASNPSSSATTALVTF